MSEILIAGSRRYSMMKYHPPQSKSNGSLLTIKMIKKICKNCGKEFVGQNITYCSGKCYHISRIGKPTWNKGVTGWHCHSEEWKGELSKKFSKEGHPQWIKRVEKFCLNCNTIFLVKEKYYETYKYCCRKCMYEHMKGVNHPMYGKHHSERAKLLIHIKNTGLKRTTEVRKKYSCPGKLNGMYGKHHSDTTKIKCRSARMTQTFPVKNTSIEIKLFTELSNRNINFEKHKTILGLTQPDAFILPNVCLYADGDYWHNYPNGNNKDKVITNILQKNGYIVYRFWEHEINNNIKSCVDKIIEVIK